MNNCRFFGKIVSFQEGVDYLDRPELTVGILVEGGIEPITVFTQLVGDEEEYLRGKVEQGTQIMLVGSIRIGTPLDETSDSPCVIVDGPEATLVEDLPRIGDQEQAS